MLMPGPLGPILPIITLPKDVIAGYVTNFDHDGEFVLVKTSPESAEQALEIMKACGATRANRHD